MHVAFSTLLRVYKEVMTSHSKNYYRGNNLNGNQSEVLNEMIGFFLRYFDLHENEMSYKIY